MVVAHSPQAHHLHLAGDTKGRSGDAALSCKTGSGSSGMRTPAFRPPGPLQHKFGNKPRPSSAPGRAESAGRAQEAGLRDCGCPRSPCAAATIRPAQGVSRQRQMPQPELISLAAVVIRPRSAAPVLASWQPGSSTATKFAVPAAARAARGADGQSGGSKEADSGAAITTVAVAATAAAMLSSCLPPGQQAPASRISFWWQPRPGTSLQLASAAAGQH